MSEPIPDFLSGLFYPNRTPEQLTCAHILSSQMPDGKFFCPSCKLVSEVRIQRVFA